MTKKPRRNYLDADGNKLPSVTQVLALLAKPALLGWSARIAAQATAEAIIDGGMTREAAISKGKYAFNRVRDHSASLGTAAHELVERHYAGDTVVADVTTADGSRVHSAYRRIVTHLEKTKSTVIHSELAMVDLTNGYGGTMDLVLGRAGQLWVADLKTGAGVYDEVILQLGAYASLYTLTYPGTVIDGGIVIHAPLDGDVTEHHITKEQLAYGAAVFAALLIAYKNLDKCKLDKGEE